MLKPARARESAGLPCIDALWNRTVIFGLRPNVIDEEKVKYPRDIAQGTFPRKGYPLALMGHI